MEESNFEPDRNAGKDSLSMIILAGGLSRRMGTDKSDLRYRDQTFLDIQIEKGRKLGIEDILVSGYRGLECQVPVVMDRLKERGPLGGMEACFGCARHERCLVLSVDTPLVSVSELQKLIQRDRESSNLITILRHGEKQEPLIGVYSTMLSESIAAALAKGNGSVFEIKKKTGYGEYESTGNELQFQNINEKADYRRLQEKL